MTTQTGQTAPLLRGVNLRKTYRLGRVDVPVLYGASIEANAGEWIAILGASGSGKSTLLHLLGGLDQPDDGGGEVYFRGERVELNRGSETNYYRNGTIGFVFQFYHLLPELDVMENAMLAALVGRKLQARVYLLLFTIAGAVAGGWIGVMLALSWGLLPVAERTELRATVLGGACAILGAAAVMVITQGLQAFAVRKKTRSSQAADVARGTIHDFGLEHRMRHRPRELSGGERQRVAIARALGNNPEVLLADEPTGNLDAKTGREILDLLKERHEQGLTIVMVTHDPEVAAYADRVVRLEDGRICSQDDVSSPSRSSDAIHV